MRRQDAVPHLHAKLRDCVDMMGVGGAAPRADTVAEDTAAVARTAIDGKDLADVKCGPVERSKPAVDPLKTRTFEAPKLEALRNPGERLNGFWMRDSPLNHAKQVYSVGACTYSYTFLNALTASIVADAVLHVAAVV